MVRNGSGPTSVYPQVWEESRRVVLHKGAEMIGSANDLLHFCVIAFKVLR